MRRIVALLSVVAILFAASMHVMAASESYGNATANLSFSGTTATCKLNVVASNMSYPIEASVKLMHGSTVVAQWSNMTSNGYMFFSDTASVVSGYTYTMKITLKINGVSYDIADITKTCP